MSKHPLHATIEEFAADGYTHVECYCPRCRMIRLRPFSWLPRISLGLTIAQLSARLRCAECGGQVHSVKLWSERITWMAGGQLQSVPWPWVLRARYAVSVAVVTSAALGRRRSSRPVGFAVGDVGFLFAPTKI